MQNTILPGALNQVPADLLTGAGNQFEAKVRAVREMSGEKQRSELKKVSQDFEAVFISYMLKVMRETIEETGLSDGGPGKSIYTELFDQEIAQKLAQHGTLGISDMLYNNLVGTVSENDSNNIKPESQGLKSKPDVSQSIHKEIHEIDNVNSYDISRMQLPVRAPVSSVFGTRTDPFTHKIKFHKGLDLAAPEGMTVVAALPGKVIESGYEEGYGNYVLIKHSEELQTRYGHLGTIHVKKGDTVTTEQSLGTVGSTGHSTGPHLHFEAIRMGTPVNPLPVFRSQLASLR